MHVALVALFILPVQDSTLRRLFKQADAAYQGGDFKDKLAGEKQLDKLGPEESLRILLALSVDSDPAVRLIAVKHLAKLDHPNARDRLARLAKNDPDPTVRDLAGGK